MSAEPPVGESNEQRFEKLLPTYVSALYNLQYSKEQKHLTLRFWSVLLNAYPAKRIIQAISDMTLPEVKKILGAETPPDVRQLLDLPTIDDDDWMPGVYLGIVLRPKGRLEVRIYVGSATARF